MMILNILAFLASIAIKILKFSIPIAIKILGFLKFLMIDHMIPAQAIPIGIIMALVTGLWLYLKLKCECLGCVDPGITDINECQYNEGYLIPTLLFIRSIILIISGISGIIG